MDGNALVFVLFVLMSSGAYICCGETVPLKVHGFELFSPKNNGSFPNKWTYSNDIMRACSSGQDDSPDGYYISPLVETSPANAVTISVSYRLKDCSASGFYGAKCKLFFEVYISRMSRPYPLDSNFRPDPMRVKYEYIGKFANSSVLPDAVGFSDTFTLNVSVDLKGHSGMFIAFRDRGACCLVSSVSVSYKKCPAAGGDLIKFNAVPAPSSSSHSLRVNGTCSDYSIPKTSAANNYMKCFANGTATIYGGCKCKKGFEMASATSCTACTYKTYKPDAGNIPCFKCAANVEDGPLGNTILCKCLPGFYRPTAVRDEYAADCEEPPSAPRNVKATSIGPTWAFLRWEMPTKQGTGDTVTYSVDFKQSLLFTRPTTANLYYNLTGLNTYTTYNITVYSVNNVTTATGEDVFIKMHFRTKSGLPGVIRNLKLKRNDDQSVTLSWDQPQDKGGPDLKYLVKVNNGNGVSMKAMNYTIKQEKETKKYFVSIQSYTSAGFSKAVTTEFTIQGKAQGIPLTVGIAVGCSFFVLIVIAVLLVVYFYRRRHPKHLQPVRLENGEVILPSRSSGAQVYVDPTTYQDLADAVREFAKELDRKWIELETIIGGGEFGDVYKGSLRRPLEDERVVAIKTLKATSNKKAKDDFLSEAAYMGQFEDPNVIGLEGVVVKDRPIMIIIEFMSNGSLDSYLQENDGKFTSLQLLGMARGVSSGMTYLAEMSFIHRDLAARNILVDDNMVCKVADFGMSRELSEEETYNTTGGKIPVRWTAPEAIQYKKFTTASDVWSYGILLWEIMSYGERPYWDWGNYEVIERLASGYRLPPPMGCPNVVHHLMLSCWHKDRVKRPKFRDVRNTIDKWIRSPELLKQEASVVTKRDENVDYASMKTLKEWLDSIKLGQYIENFTNKGIVTPRQILELSEDDLKGLGILAIGHRNKLIKSINATKNQLHRTCTLERTKSAVV